ncbi:class I SAM-dependent methyltransferase [Yinghuangia seranimata]|uniref:class I SAM-dependent methyltransferase n=1 Tax=Yinghuangia seranimata TaxID=408067 RepID=UPI00248B2B73|nr:class I SAM-dependent methyltransferase [Yinghuangia seranimata]MDI2127241.1 class I SAM-dependent methyltransferase [Yinghuangia seranimata]
MNIGFTPFPWLALLLLLGIAFGALRARARVRKLDVLETPDETARAADNVPADALAGTADAASGSGAARGVGASDAAADISANGPAATGLTAGAAGATATSGLSAAQGGRAGVVSASIGTAAGLVPSPSDTTTTAAKTSPNAASKDPAGGLFGGDEDGAKNTSAESRSPTAAVAPPAVPATSAPPGTSALVSAPVGAAADGVTGTGDDAGNAAAIGHGDSAEGRSVAGTPDVVGGSGGAVPGVGVAGGGASVDELPDGYRWVTAVGVQPDEGLLRAASEYARVRGILVLDLVPADLPVEALLDLVREVDPQAFRGDAVAAGRGAAHALLVHDSVLQRADVDRTRGLSQVEMAALTARLKRYAPRETGHVVTSAIPARTPDPAEVKARARALGAPPAAVLGGWLGEFGAFLGAAYVTPFWGLVALGAWWLQPYAVLAGRTPVRPRGRHAAVLLRPLHAAVFWLRAAAGPRAPKAVSADELAEKRARYAADLALGVDRFLEPRRDTCPWCGSPHLEVRLRTRDRLQGKPGRFTLERCRDCAHVFQNPRLTLAGLDFYYRDFYDGLGEHGAEAMFATMSRHYVGRARLVKRHAEPVRWLDVGTGHAHMCLAAKAELPSTAFDGLDLGAGVEEAARRGWIERAYVGQFPDHADQLSGSYDVVSMHHYLEHTRDPQAELDAAAKVIQPGGHLLIELPDPECRYRLVLRSFWHPWFQPQHQHFMPLGNLTVALEARGFRVVEVERGPAHQSGLLVAALTQVMTAVAPSPARPWARERGRVATAAVQAWRTAVFVALVPAYVLGAVGDVLGAVVARRFGPTGGSDAFRLLARKEPG